MRLSGMNGRVVFTGLAALGLCLAGAAEVRAQTSSPGLNLFLQNLTPAARAMAEKSLAALSPAGRQAVEREYDDLGRLNDFGAFGWGDARTATARICSNVLRYVPAGSQQRFMNGLLGGSPADERFANAVLRAYLEVQRANTRLAIQGAADTIRLAGEAAEAVHRACQAFK